MICPTCNHGLLARSYKGIDIEQCQYCGGIWFDVGEFNEMHRINEKGLAKSEDHEARYRAVPGNRADYCPLCVKPTLVQGTIATKVVSRCTLCSGLWVHAVPKSGRQKNEEQSYYQGEYPQDYALAADAALEAVFAIIEYLNSK